MMTDGEREIWNEQQRDAMPTPDEYFSVGDEISIDYLQLAAKVVDKSGEMVLLEWSIEGATDRAWINARKVHTELAPDQTVYWIAHTMDMQDEL